ncbi:MAG: Sua5 family C-terminal domain-containing protein, partial [Pseudomonadota bacterium]
ARCPAVILGGSTDAGLESTIVALRDKSQWSLLRPGPVTKEALEEILGAETALAKTRIEAPGQMARHYSPGKPLRPNATEVAQDEFWIGFGSFAGDCNLSESGDLEMAAAELYECLHRAAASPKPCIAVAPIPKIGIGRAINDRLKRAATQ